jgi:hypothetical protein
MSARMRSAFSLYEISVASVLLRRATVISASVRKRTVAWPTVAGILITALYLGHAWIFGGYIADDAGISLAYARNMVSGFGPVLYAGGEAVEGYSNPLWVALLGAGAAIGLDGADGIPLMKALGLVFGLGTLLLTAIAARTAYPADAPVKWLAPAVLASLTPFVFWTTSGLENSLYAFLVLLAVTLQLRELEHADAKQWSALALAGVALTRPEGAALFIAFLLHRLIYGQRGVRLLKWTAAFVIIYGLFLGSRLLMFGEWVPNTYYAKVDMYDRHLTRLVKYILDPGDRGTRYVLDSARTLWPLLIVATAGLTLPRQWRTNLLLGGLLVGTALYVIYVGGDFWPAERFLTATLPLLALAAQHGVNRWLPRRLSANCVAAVLVSILLNRSLAASSELQVLDKGDILIGLQGKLNHAHRLQAVASALGIKDPLLLDPDIGGPSLAGLRVVDLGGLADIHIARFHYYAPFFRDYIFHERRPDFIRTHDTWTTSSRVTEFPEFEQQYAAIRSWRDARGLHGEFVRRDLLAGGGRRRDMRPARLPSFRQAIEDGRARRRREADRAKTRGISSAR